MDAQVYFKTMAETFECDCCNKKTEPKDRGYVLSSRPSDRTELVAVMWTCPECAPQVGAKTSEEAEEYRKKNGYYFLSL